MAQRFSSDQFKKIVAKAAAKPYVPKAVKDTMKEKGMSKLLHQSASRKQVIGALKTLQKEGVISSYRQPAKVVRGMEKKFEESVPKTHEPSRAELRVEQKKQEEEALKEKRRGATKTRMAQAYHEERQHEEEVEAKKIADAAAKTEASRTAEKSVGLPTKPAIDLPID